MARREPERGRRSPDPYYQHDRRDDRPRDDRPRDDRPRDGGNARTDERRWSERRDDWRRDERGDRDRDRDWDRDRDRERDRDRFTDDARERARDLEQFFHSQVAEADDEYFAAQAHREARDPGARKREEEQVSNVVIVRGLAPATTGDTIKQHLTQEGFYVVDARIVRSKDNGESRGFALVDFSSPEEATRFLGYHSSASVPLVIDGHSLSLGYGRPSVGSDPHDWICTQCQGQNFARRTACYLCHLPRAANAKLVEESVPANGCVMVRGLSPVTDEAALMQAFGGFGAIKEVRVVRDKHTRTSKGLAFVEFESPMHAADCVRKGNNTPVDGQAVRLSYSKRTIQEAIANAPSHAPHQPLSGKALELLQQAQAAQYYSQIYSQMPPAAAVAPPPTVSEAPAATPAVPLSAEAQAAVDARAMMLAMEKAERRKKKEKEKAVTEGSLERKKAEKEIEKWNKRKTQEAEGEQPKADADADKPPSADAPPAEPAQGKSKKSKEEVTIPEHEQVVGNICIICKRQFQSADTIKKHLTQSDLHKQNLAAAIEKKRDHERQLAAERSAEAKARREQRLAEVKKKEEEAAAAAALERQMGPAQVPTQATYMEEGSFASKMMKSMGWRPGDGLGREGAGITAPIEVSKRADRVGLGGATDTVSAVPWSTLKETSKLKTMARFQDLQANERPEPAGGGAAVAPPPPGEQPAGALGPTEGREEGTGGLGLGM